MSLDVFSKFQPLSINLSKDDSKETIDIEGIATTEHQDTSGEIILQSGLDWSYCLKNGSFNYDHSNLPGHIVGAPTEIKQMVHNGKPATSIKGVLYAKKQIVKDLVENYKAMKSAGNIRKLGFSIEGQVLARDSKNPHIITRAKVLNVSLTHQPCNTEATVAMVKNILSNIEKEEKMSEELTKSDANLDLPMTYDQTKLLCDYAQKMKELLESLPESYDLPEWLQSKITKSLDYMQSSYHYLEIESKEEKMEMDKDVNPDYLESLEEESVVSPEKVVPPAIDRDNDYPQSFEMEKGYYKTDEEMDKMDRKQMIDYARFLEGLVKESDLSPIQPQSLEDDDKPLASQDMNMGESDEEEPEIELEVEGLSPEQLKELIMGMLQMKMPVSEMMSYIKRYSKDKQ